MIATGLIAQSREISALLRGMEATYGKPLARIELPTSPPDDPPELPDHLIDDAVALYTRDASNLQDLIDGNLHVGMVVCAIAISTAAGRALVEKAIRAHAMDRIELDARDAA